ncbi:hypothetical protein MMC25_008210 [Agyrium rufum]|nr:hypothetical protein [Agyrium rufum]
MSFGSGFSGFGANNNNNNNNNNNPQQSTGGFGFGGTGNTNTFGQPQQQSTPLFGGGTTGGMSGSLFGNTNTGTATNTFGGFGAAKPFGQTTTSSSPFGTASNATAAPAFGGFGGGNTSSTNTSLFGGAQNQNRPTGFGTNNTASLFGGGANNANAFGTSSTTPNAFGASGTALGQPLPDCQGTGSTPFDAVKEEENTKNGKETSNYQTISFMAPYSKYSLEELRLADYVAGRQFGNANGQAGGFGVNNSFGGFSNAAKPATTGTGLFGGAQTSSSFGNLGTQATGGGFGGFGGTSNLFGGSNNSTQPQNTGMFSSNNVTSNSPFATSTNATSNGGNLFGNPNQQQKPGGFSFGGTAITNTNAFGSGSTSNLFGGGQNTSTGFGQPANTITGFGGAANTSNDANKPSLFGSTTQPTNNPGVFGQQNNQTTTTNPFGGNTQNNSSNLFKSSTGTGPGLFGGASTNTGSNLFGNSNQNQQNSTPSLFGNTNTNNNQSTSTLFGAPKPANTGSTLFGGSSTNQQPPNSIFGTQANNQNQNNNSMLGSSNQNNSFTQGLWGSQQPAFNALQAPQALTGSMLNNAPYGSASIFSGLPPPPQASPGPIATPIQAGQRANKPVPLPAYKLNAGSTSRFMTPTKRGYGFSYSSYGTPSSVSSTVSTPGGFNGSSLGGGSLGGFGGSLMGTSMGRSLGKSYSMNNLHRRYETDAESVLAPGAFSPTATRYSTGGSLKRLTIDRSLRTDLFGTPPPVPALPSIERDPNRQSSILKKQVSFDSTTKGSEAQRMNDEDSASSSGPSGSSATVSATPSAQEQGFLRSSRKQPRTSTNANTLRMNGYPDPAPSEQSKGKELAIVPEDDASSVGTAISNQSSDRYVTADQSDPVLKDCAYFMKPPKEELKTWSHDKLKKVSGFVIGREKVATVHYDKPVDLSGIDLDHIYGNEVEIVLRDVRIYPDKRKGRPPGQGLNFPATIFLNNAWPRRDAETPRREKFGRKYEKHLEKLANTKDTTFVRYESDTGIWVFKVQHFSSYGLVYEMDDDESDTSMTSPLSDVPESPTPSPRPTRLRGTPLPNNVLQGSSTMSDDNTEESSGLEDTFDFRKKKLVPGTFDVSHAIEVEDDDVPQMSEARSHQQAFLGQRSVPLIEDNGEDEPSEDYMEDDQDTRNGSQLSADNEMEVTGSFPHDETLSQDLLAESIAKPKSILKTTHRTDFAGTPQKLAFEVASDWADQLRRTVSPKKRDRVALRESAANLISGLGSQPEPSWKEKSQLKEKGILTSIDLMNSLFGKEELRRSGKGGTKHSADGKGFEWPYSKKSKPFSDESEMIESDQAFHRSFKPRWAQSGLLLYRQARNDRATDEGGDVHIAPFADTPNLVTANLAYQRSRTKVNLDQAVPCATTEPISFQDMEKGVPEHAEQERLTWKLASILFDEYDDEISAGVPALQRPLYESRIKKDRLTEFWESVCQEQALDALAKATCAEEKAIAYLSMHRVDEACSILVEDKNFRLATLLAQIGTDVQVQGDMTQQIKSWRDQRVISEMTDPMRALYGLIAGNATFCEGWKGNLEDQASSFGISERFHLDWKRAFGLRLWYASVAEMPIEQTISMFEEDLVDGESMKPISLDEGKDQGEKEDILWSFLKLYAAYSSNHRPTDAIKAIIACRSEAGSKGNSSRLPFQLVHALSRAGFYADSADADRISIDFAMELDSLGEWIWAAFVLLHLADHEKRERSLRSLVSSHAGDIGDQKSSSYTALVKEFKIPEAWIWAAKAVFAHAVTANDVQQVEFLLRARDWEGAHRVLTTIVAPQTIIAHDHVTLRKILDQFVQKDQITGWDLGGQIYEDYLRLLKGLSIAEKDAVLRRLVGALITVQKEKGNKMELEEMIAMKEMSNFVGKMVLSDKLNADMGSKVLNLPLTESAYLRNTHDLSLHYYKTVMAGGK